MNDRADHAGTDTVLGGLGAIDLQGPINAGRGQAIGNVDDARNLGKPAGDRAGVVVQAGRIDGGDTRLDRLSGWRACFGHPDLDLDAGNAAHDLAQIVEDLAGRLALAPIREFVLDDADDVFVDVLRATTVLADARIDGRDTRPAEQSLFGLARGAVHLLQGEVAARRDIHQAVVRLDIGEELDARAILRIAVLNADKNAERQQKDGLGIRDGLLRDGHVETVRLRGLVDMGLCEHGPDRGGEEQRVDQRSGERNDQRDRQILHELADDARPEQ